MDLGVYRTLLLDAAWRPVLVVGWQRALTLSVTDRVEVLEVYDREVRSARASFLVPAVARLRHFVLHGDRPVALTRRNVLLRDKNCCQYCQRVFAVRELTLDHVVPRSRGGRSSWTNLVTACGPCNHRKASRTPAEARMPLPRPPVAPRGLSVERDGMYTGTMPDAWRQYLNVA